MATAGVSDSVKIADIVRQWGSVFAGARVSVRK